MSIEFRKPTSRPRERTAINFPITLVRDEFIQQSVPVPFDGGTIAQAITKLRELWTSEKIDHISLSPVEAVHERGYAVYVPEHHVGGGRTPLQQLDKMAAEWADQKNAPASVYIDTVKFPEDREPLKVGKIVITPQLKTIEE